MNNELKTLFLNHTGKLTDKWSHYINELEKIFYPYQHQSINLLEIGVENGGSLEIWAKYFVNAKNIIGCDINESCQKLVYQDPRISLVIGNAYTDEVEDRLFGIVPSVDIIIDDGSQNSSNIIRSFERYFKHLNENGIYVIENLYTSYWEEFSGGLYNPFSAMAFFKRLADIINYEHWRNGQNRTDFLSAFNQKLGINLNKLELCRIHSIQFINSLCIIQKCSAYENKLGKRIVSGLDEQITTGLMELKETSLIDQYPEIQENQSEKDIFYCLEKARQLKIDISERDNIIQSLSSEIPRLQKEKERLQVELDEKEQEVLHYALSRSWKLTRPFRKLKRLLKVNRND